MDARDEKDQQRESESDRKRPNPGLPFDDRISKKLKLCGGPLTKSAAEVDKISKACDGNDRNGHEELGLEHPSSESIDVDMYDLPLEVLDVILEKSYLHWVLNSSTEQRNEEVIRSLISVDVCFSKRTTRQRFKKAIWRYLKGFYGKTKKRHANIRNNRKYLVNNIQPNDELMSSLLRLKCITKEQSHFIQSQCSTREKNYKLLYVMETLNETKFSNFVNCLRRRNQRTVANIIENGGGVIQIQVKTCDPKCSASMLTQLLHTKINDLRERTKPRSHETDKLIAQLRDEGLEILSSQMDGQTVVVWMRCHSQTAVENLQSLYESNQLRDKYFENIHPATSKVINIASNQFKKTIVVRPITIDVTQRIEMPEIEEIRGVTKLGNEIYVLSQTELSETRDAVRRNYAVRIHVFEDRYPFRLQNEIKADEINNSSHMGSSEKKNCLYVSEIYESCVWKITRETDDQYKIIEWLTTDYEPWTLSVSRDGELMMFSRISHSLMVYGSDAKLIRSIPLTKDIFLPYHAVETSIGNFIIVDMHILPYEEDEVKITRLGIETPFGNLYIVKEDEDEDEDENEEEEVKEEDLKEHEVKEEEVKDEEVKEEEVKEEEVKGEEDMKDEEEEKKQRELVSVVSDKDEDEDEEEEEEEEEEDAVMEEGKPTDWFERQEKALAARRKTVNMEFIVSEFTRDGQMVIRRFIPSSETQQLDNCSYLSIDSDDRVFVADMGNDRVILLDSDLKWNQILCPTMEEKEEQIIKRLRRFFYDEEMKQLIVAKYSHEGDQVNVHTLRL